MREPFDFEEFSRLTEIPGQDLQSMVDAGLLDPDGDSRFDEYDALRLWTIRPYLAEGLSVKEISLGLADGSIHASFHGEELFPREPRSRSLGQVAEAVGLTVEELDELHVAVGLVGPAVYGDDDIQAFRAAKLVKDAGLPWKAILEVGRVYGDAFRRIARTEVAALDKYLFDQLLEDGMNEVEATRRIQGAIGILDEIVGPLLDFFHRQYVIREAAKGVLNGLVSNSHREAHDSDSSTIVFVDLTSFTMLAQIQGDETAAEVLDSFDSRVRSHVLRFGGSLVKQIGDAFMLIFDDSTDAVRFALALVESATAEGDLLAPRIGIHSGRVLYRVGDYVGNTVNLASRVATEAMPNEILVTEPVAEAALKAGIATSPVGVRVLRGSSDPLSLHRINSSSGPPPVMRDPVCGAEVGVDAVARLLRDGEEVAFHSEGCLRRYLADPERYAPKTAAGPLRLSSS